MLSARLRMMLEDVQGEDTSGQAVQEVEHVFYGKIADANQLMELAKQPYVEKHLQEQSQCQIVPAGADKPSTLRIRRVNGEKCVLTRKTFIPGQAGMQEETVECGAELFEFLSRSFGEGMAKMRYTIKPEAWPKPIELDCFVDANGHPTGYAKFDFEVTTQEETPPPLPLTLTDLKHVNPYTSTDADRALLREFMKAQTFKTI